MKFKEIIKSTSWEEVLHTLYEFYANEEDRFCDYESMYKKLLVMEETSSTIMIKVKVSRDEFDEDDTELYPDVSGYDSAEDEGSRRSLALEFTPWTQWLGMGIDEKSLSEFNPNQITAHCMAEIAWGGMTEKESQKNYDELNRRAEELSNLDIDKAIEEGKIVEINHEDDLPLRIKAIFNRLEDEGSKGDDS